MGPFLVQSGGIIAAKRKWSIQLNVGILQALETRWSFRGFCDIQFISSFQSWKVVSVKEAGDNWAPNFGQKTGFRERHGSRVGNRGVRLCKIGEKRKKELTKLKQISPTSMRN